MDARPKGFMTQVIQNIEQVQNLSDNLEGFSVIPILLYPSDKNEKSAKFLNLDLASYSQEFEELLKKTHEITGDVLLTSPSDFSGLNEFLGKLSLFR
jgi:homocysteine S-methyltransferase